MRLASGTRLGPYEIQSAIGAGGMGEVYQARDTRLERTVAIKILPAHLAHDRERRVRFEREARTIASLSHPHICALFDIGEALLPSPESRAPSPEPVHYLVMEYLAGDTLAERLRRGPLPLDQALAIAAQIADGLAAAHRQGVVHRDLKPGNVMLMKAGAKLLDFGLAKLRPEASAVSHAVTVLPTREPATVEGMILGTVPYMAPEQLEGRDADARSDIFSFGAVLYEMLTGRQAFPGHSHASVISAILKDDPPLISSLQAATPPAVERLVRKCLQKDPDARWQTAADVADELRWVATLPTAVSGSVAPASSRRRRLPTAAVAGVVLLLIAALVGTGLALWRPWPATPAAPSAFLAIPVSTSGLTLGRGAVAVSPDGQTVAFSASRPGEVPMLFIRRLRDREPQALKGTEGAMLPFFSHDGKHVAYFDRRNVWRVPLDGGKPQPLITDPDWRAGDIVFGGVWGADNRVVFGGGYIAPGIWQVPASGGKPEALVTAEDGVYCNLPDLLPDGDGVVFTRFKGGRSSIHAWSRTAGAPREVIANASRARYLPIGALLYEQEGSLKIVGFNTSTLQTTGDAQVAVEDVGTGWETAAWDVSPTGTLVFPPPYVGLRRLVWRNRRGDTTPLPLKDAPYLTVSLSPDNERIIVGMAEGLRRRIWWGRTGGEALQPFTHGFDDVTHAFSPDGRWVTFGRHEKGQYHVFRTPADGSDTVEQLTDGSRPEALPAVKPPDGRVLLFNSPEPAGDYHIWQKSLDPLGPPRPFVHTPSVTQETAAAFSRDGRWVAYMSNEGGRALDVWVKPFPDGERVQVSTGGGANPVWNPAADEVFYQTPTSLMSVRFANGRPGRPVALFALRPGATGSYTYQFSVSRDGSRFLLFESSESASQPPLIYVLSNWLEPLKAKLALQR